MSSNGATFPAEIVGSTCGTSGGGDAILLSGAEGACAGISSGGDGGVALGARWDNEISDVDRYRQAAAQYFAGREDDDVDEENPSSAAYVAQGSVMYSYHAGSELRFGIANAMGKLTGVTPVG